MICTAFGVSLQGNINVYVNTLWRKLDLRAELSLKCLYYFVRVPNLSTHHITGTLLCYGDLKFGPDIGTFIYCFVFTLYFIST